MVEGTVGLEADEEGQLRNQHRCVGGHAAAALRLEGAGEEVQAVGGFGVALQSEGEFGIALLVGRTLLQFVAVAFLGALRVVEAVIGIAAESRIGRAQGQRRLDAAIGSRRTEQVLRVDQRLEFRRLHPAVGHFARQAC